MTVTVTGLALPQIMRHWPLAGTKLLYHIPLSDNFVIMVMLVQWLSGYMICFHGAEQGSSLYVVNVHFAFSCHEMTPGSSQARADIPWPRPQGHHRSVSTLDTFCSAVARHTINGIYQT